MTMTLDEFAMLVGRRVSLRKAGNRYVGLCPFHNEKTASFHVYWASRRNSPRYHCHGCGSDGDVGDWMQKVEKKQYPEYCKDTASFATIRHQRELQIRKERARQEYMAKHIDCCPEEWLFVEKRTS